MNDGWYVLNDGWKGYVDLKFGAERKQTMKIELDVEVPEGYEATSEYRRANDGEYRLQSGRAVLTSGRTAWEYLILRKKKSKVIVFVPDAKGAFFEDSNLQMARIFGGTTFKSEWRYSREEREEA